MKFTSTIFFGLTLLFASVNFAQQPAPYQPINNGTRQTQPMQIPPKNITTNGVLTYQNQTNPQTQLTPGFNSPFPTNRTQPTNTTNTNQQQTRYYQPNPNQPYPNQPNPNQPNVNQPYPNPNQPNPNQPNVNQPYPNQLNPNQPNANQPYPNRDIRPVGGDGVRVAESADAGRVSVVGGLPHYVGHSAPAVRVHPFALKPEEQRELDDFLLRWEHYSEKVKNYEVDFNAFFYDPTNPLSPPITTAEPQLKPIKIMFGYFKYVAPKKFVYHIEGEWLQKERMKYIDAELTPNIAAEKTIIDGQSLFFYDFPAKKVTQYKMPPEMLNRTIANGPFPLIFGAKSADLKKRFSMKIVTNPDYRDKEIWLWAVPLLSDDQQEFVKIEIRLDKRTLDAKALKRIDPNEKSYTTYTLENPKVNRFLRLDAFFNPDVPRGWKLEIQDQSQTNLNQTPHNNTTQKPPNTKRNEIPLYNP
ncbi:MAG: hypothetical protein LBP59_08475 [Planctomycetaceae bacterium]|nr:hypothetical protein [Planctomycetaceae bacterium]